MQIRFVGVPTDFKIELVTTRFVRVPTDFKIKLANQICGSSTLSKSNLLQPDLWEFLQISSLQIFKFSSFRNSTRYEFPHFRIKL
ncbi:hypothetical protein AWU66_05060 [Leptospira interrogans serovar Pomona]|nr:hypothetical protein AWU66_05060 [Leptospira interrogans serovar Pomona]